MGFFSEVTEALKKGIDSLSYMATQGIDTTLVGSDEAIKRMQICKGCPKLQKPFNKCAECGCFMDVKTKLVYDPFLSVENKKPTITTCPDGKW